MASKLIRLCNEFDVVVEINASSNYALGHIDSIGKIPIKFYKDNNIKCVISTDGGGVYSTSIHQDENLFDYSDISEVGDTEKEQINLNGSGKPTKEAEELYKKYKEYRIKKYTSPSPNTFEEAENEEKAHSNNGKIDLVQSEMDDLERYIMDNNPDIDIDYYYEMIDVINKYRQDDNDEKRDYSKMFLYLFEKEILPYKQTMLKKVEYIDNLSNIDEYLNDRNITDYKWNFEAVKILYLYESNRIKQKYQDSKDSYAKGR